jgi:hypothetical protein
MTMRKTMSATVDQSDTGQMSLAIAYAGEAKGK